MEALGKPSTFNQAVMSVRDGGRAVMIGLAPFGVTTDVEISRLVRRQVLTFFLNNTQSKSLESFNDVIVKLMLIICFSSRFVLLVRMGRERDRTWQI